MSLSTEKAAKIELRLLSVEENFARGALNVWQIQTYWPIKGWVNYSSQNPVATIKNNLGTGFPRGGGGPTTSSSTSSLINNFGANFGAAVASSTKSAVGSMRRKTEIGTHLSSI